MCVCRACIKQSALVNLCWLGRLSSCWSCICIVSLMHALPCELPSYASTSIYQDLIHLVGFVLHLALHAVTAGARTWF
jgi:hypothetical protein